MDKQHNNRKNKKETLIYSTEGMNNNSIVEDKDTNYSNNSILDLNVLVCK